MHTVFHKPDWLSVFLEEDFQPEAFSASDQAALQQRLKTLQSDKPEISVILPVKNHYKTLYRTLCSISYICFTAPTELIVVDANSADGSADMARNLGLKVVREYREGMAYARQKGLECAIGKFVLTASADTVYPPRWGESMIHALRTQKHNVCIYGKYNLLPEKIANWQRGVYRYFADPIHSLRSVKHEFINVLGCNMAFRRIEALRVGGYPGEHEIDRLGTRESDVGKLVLRLGTTGKLKLIDSPDTRVWISAAPIAKEGGLLVSFWRKTVRELIRLFPKRKVISVD